MKALAVLALLLCLGRAAFAQPSALAGIDAALEAYRGGDAVAAINLLHPLADGGNPEAQFTLGMVLEFGLASARKAALWYARASASGHAGATNSLGAMYFDGRGVPEDRERARELYLAAAQEDYAPAQYNLAQIYGQGLAGPRDDAQMIRWIERASFELGRCYEMGLGVQPDAAEALRYYRRSADAEYPLAIERLLRVYRDGELGVAPDHTLVQLMTIRLRLARTRRTN